MESDQAKWATEWIENHLWKLNGEDGFIYGDFFDYNRESTFIFEAIYPENANVVLYGKRTECVLLTVIDHNGNEWRPHVVDNMADIFGFSRPQFFKFDLSRTQQFKENEEGYVAYWPDKGLRVKIKSPEYVRLHKVKDNFTEKAVCEILTESRYATFVEILPPHLREQADDLAAALRTKFYARKNQAEDVFHSIKNLPTRKDKALAIQAQSPKEIWPLVFFMLDAPKYPTEILDRLIWQSIYKEL